jgi:hypothetical protein
VAHVFNQQDARLVPAIAAATGILEADLRRTRVAGGVERSSGFAEVMAAGGRTGPIAADVQDFFDAERVPFGLAAVGIAARAVTDGVDTGVAIRIQAGSHFTDVV